VLRTAAIAGGGAALYHAGKNKQANADHEVAQDEAIQETAYQQAAPPAAPPPPAAGGMSAGAIDELKQLGQLHEQGILTDEEFAAQKAKILGG